MTWITQDSLLTTIKRKFETLDPKIAKGIVKIIPTEFMRKMDLLGEKIQSKADKAQRQADHVSELLVLRSQQNTGQVEILTDLLDDELYNDNLKQIHPA